MVDRVNADVRIRVVEHSGFCFGVKRAIAIVENGLKRHKKLYSFGPLIHNPQIVDSLHKKGLQQFSNRCDFPVVIRSHGIIKSDLEELKAIGCTHLDATCPYVKNAQKQIIEYEKKGYKIVIFGDHYHQEVRGLVSYSKRRAIVVEDIGEIPKDLDKYPLIAVLSQTTKARKDFLLIFKKIKELNSSALKLDTICGSTQVRQTETVKLAQESELMIVVGGKNSANTKMLAKISSKYSKTLHIETEDELAKKDFVGYKNIGITSGASTPNWMTKKVKKKIEKMLS